MTYPLSTGNCPDGTRKIILFNGPPGCGKDTAAEIVMKGILPYGYSHIPYFDRFSMPIKRAFAATVGGYIDSRGTVFRYENRKDEPLDLLGGKTYRQWQIAFAEDFMRPKFGQDIFANLFLEREAARVGFVTVVPDSGFQVEFDRLREAIPNENILLVRIHREGFDFSNDSREYILDDAGCHSEDIENDNLFDFHSRIQRIVGHFLGGSLR